MKELYEIIRQINEQYGLEIDPDTVAEIYGEDVLEKMAESPYDVEQNIRHLISLHFGEDVSDICNRYGILLCEDPAVFFDRVWQLISSIGEDYVDKMGEDMSYWEALM